MERKEGGWGLGGVGGGTGAVFLIRRKPLTRCLVTILEFRDPEVKELFILIKGPKLVLSP